MGKSGQHQHKRVTDRAVARIIKRLDELPGYEIFKYYDAEGNLTRVNSKDVNQYIKNVMGEEFSAKDFRTWGGTLLASVELAAVTRANSERERKRTVNVCIRKVARKLGNTPAIARGSYIDPRIISSFLAGDDLKTIRDAVANVGEKGYLSNDEQCVLRLLQKTA
ncbi:MAG: topoisomerase [Candidatus Saccharibacteria bacterium]|nr:topoisomerase [Candidatus Saccharibacteria bacterium]